jgi:hypothetical protein
VISISKAGSALIKENPFKKKNFEVFPQFFILEAIAHQIYLMKYFCGFFDTPGVPGTLTQIEQTRHCWFEAWD